MLCKSFPKIRQATKHIDDKTNKVLEQIAKMMGETFEPLKVPKTAEAKTEKAHVSNRGRRRGDAAQAQTETQALPAPKDAKKMPAPKDVKKKPEKKAPVPKKTDEFDEPQAEDEEFGSPRDETEGEEEQEHEVPAETKKGKGTKPFRAVPLEKDRHGASLAEKHGGTFKPGVPVQKQQAKPVVAKASVKIQPTTKTQEPAKKASPAAAKKEVAPADAKKKEGDQKETSMADTAMKKGTDHFFRNQNFRPLIVIRVPEHCRKICTELATKGWGMVKGFTTGLFNKVTGSEKSEAEVEVHKTEEKAPKKLEPQTQP